MPSHRTGVALVLGLLCLRAPESTAQTPQACTYHACALRLRQSFFKVQLVQGTNQRPVGSLGWFPPALSLFAERSDTAARHYSSFRRRQTSGLLLSLTGVVALTAGLAVYDGDNDLGLILGLGGGLLGIGGAIQSVRANEQLSQAVWWYNRTLAASP
jgi:hypothetical protein